MAANPAEVVEPERATGDDPHDWTTQRALWLGAVNYHTGETVVIIRRRKRRKEVTELLWRHFRREETHCELFLTLKKLISASYDFFNRYNQLPDKTLSLIGAIPK